MGLACDRSASGGAGRNPARSGSMNWGRRSLGRGGEDSSGPLQDLHVFAEPAVLPAQLRQLPPVRAGQLAAVAGPGIPAGQVEPCLDRRRRRVTILRELTGRSVSAPAQLNDLGLVDSSARTATPVVVPPI